MQSAKDARRRDRRPRSTGPQVLELDVVDEADDEARLTNRDCVSSDSPRHQHRPLGKFSAAQPVEYFVSARPVAASQAFEAARQRVVGGQPPSFPQVRSSARTRSSPTPSGRSTNNALQTAAGRVGNQMSLNAERCRWPGQAANESSHRQSVRCRSPKPKSTAIWSGRLH